MARLEIRYDTIRDAILTYARKPTWVSLIYCTEPTTKKCKNRKTKSRKQIMLRNNSELSGESQICLQCCWLGGRIKGIRPVKKTEWWGAGMVICLELGADLHMAQLMLLRLFVLRHHCCSSAATLRRHCFSHRTLHHSVWLCDRL